MKTTKALITLLLFSSASYCSMEVTVFDVGQGNAVLFGHKGTKKNTEPPLLNDCGSSSYNYRKENHKTNQIKAIVEKIKEYTKSIKQKIFNIVISHPDSDHYNWIVNIIMGCSENGIKVGKVTLGGLKKFYKKDFSEFLDTLKAQIKYLTEENGDTIKTHRISTSNKLTYDILPSLQQISEKKSNDCSLVLLITFGNLKCIVMADATSKTIEHIENSGYEFPETYLYIASHHGAAEDGCNEEILLKKLKPKMIVVSSGIHGHRHPRAEIIDRFESVLEEESTIFNPVISGIGDEEKSLNLVHHALMRRAGDIDGKGKGYGLSVTCKALYGTLQQGTLLFNWYEKATTINPPACSINGSFNTKQLCIMKSLNHPPVALLSLDFLEMINLTKLDINDANPEEKDLLQKILTALIDSKISLKELYLSFNKIQNEDIILLIKALIKKDCIRDFQMQGSTLPDSEKLTIHELWNNRGLLL